MNIIFILIPLGLILLGVAVAAFFWAVRSGQYDDLESPAWKILFDDERTPSDNLAGKILFDDDQVPPDSPGGDIRSEDSRRVAAKRPKPSR